jgi:two-component system, response regulator PdtaR
MTAPVASGWSGWPGGACTHWKAPPCHGAHVKRTLRIRPWTSQSGGSPLKRRAGFPAEFAHSSTRRLPHKSWLLGKGAQLDKGGLANYLNICSRAEFRLYGRTGEAQRRGSDRGGRASDHNGDGLPHEDAGFEVYEAGTADAAIALLELHNGIRLIVTDVDMPSSMDGVKLAHYVRGRWPPVKIIVTSGQVKVTEESLPAGALFMPKPYDPAEITRKVREMIPPDGSRHPDPSRWAR